MIVYSYDKKSEGIVWVSMQASIVPDLPGLRVSGLRNAVGEPCYLT